MDRFKFRAWDEDAEYMIYSDKPEDDYFFEFIDGKLQAFGITLDSGTITEPPQPKSYNLSNIMQFTELKDKNGKEIYESDIWQRDKTICVVEFRFAAWHLSYLKGPIQYPYSHSNANTGEIIGNIYENPELMSP